MIHIGGSLFLAPTETDDKTKGGGGDTGRGGDPLGGVGVEVR